MFRNLFTATFLTVTKALTDEGLMEVPLRKVSHDRRMMQSTGDPLTFDDIEETNVGNN
jgi:hypothetical protein